ncbi:MAG: hypothetical protein ABJB98_10665 [Actinomycetota bacterium]
MTNIRSAQRSAASPRGLVQLALRLICAAGLGVDAYVHLHLAANYDAVRTSALSEGQLFRLEAGMAALAGVFVLISARRIAAIAAVMVAGGGLALLLIYRFVQVKAFGPIPSMYEPVWFTEKTLTAWAQAAATVAALALLALSRQPTPVRPNRHEPSATRRTP